MGSSKALLELEGKSFLRWIIDIHRKLFLPVYVVLGNDHKQIRDSIDFSDVKTVINTRPELGQLSSLQAALETIQGQPSGLIVHPVDHPLVKSETIRALVNAHREYPDHILIPRRGDQKGHPVLFPNACHSELRQAPLEEGARWVVHKHPEAVFYVAVEDHGILLNIDTPEDLRKAAE